MGRKTIVVPISVAFLSSSASAQPLQSSPPRTETDFSDTRLKIGDPAYVTDPERKVEVSGVLTTLSKDALTIDGYRFAPTPGLKVERSGGVLLVLVYRTQRRLWRLRTSRTLARYRRGSRRSISSCARACSNMSPTSRRPPRRCAG
jgi:hypothetical protein